MKSLASWIYNKTSRGELNLPLCHSFESKANHRCQVGAKTNKWDVKSLKIATIENAFLSASCDVDDSAEGSCFLQERGEVVDETDTGVECQSQ
jgi:hypothetical protein